MTRRSMTMRDVFGEARRNLAAGVGGIVWLILLLALALGIGVVAPQLAITTATTRALEFQAAGAATIVVRANDAIDGRRCEALASLPNVTAVGASRETDGARLALLPSTSIRTFDVSPGFARVLNVTPRGAGLLLSEEVARTLNVATGESITIKDAGPVGVTGVFAYPDDGRRPSFTYSLLAEATPGGARFDECWVAVWPQDSEVDGLARLAFDANAAQPGVQPEILRANNTLGNYFSDANERLIWTWAGLAALGLAATATYFHVRGRRLELASARHVGVRVPDQYATTLTETLAALLCAVLIIAPAAVYLALASPITAHPLTWAAIRGAGHALTGVVLGTLLALATIRERQLFHYFRNR